MVLKWELVTGDEPSFGGAPRDLLDDLVPEIAGFVGLLLRSVFAAFRERIPKLVDDYTVRVVREREGVPPIVIDALQVPRKEILLARGAYQATRADEAFFRFQVAH